MVQNKECTARTMYKKLNVRVTFILDPRITIRRSVKKNREEIPLLGGITDY